MPFKFNPFTKKLDVVDTNVFPPGTVAALTGNTGGAVGPDGSGSITVEGGVGGGIIFTGTPGLHQLILTLPGAGWNWNPATVNFTPVAGNAYIVNAGGQITVTLPDTPAQGDTFLVTDLGGNTFKIVQNDGDSIQFGDLTTTTTTGSITSSKKGDVIVLVCWSAGPGASWLVLQPTGNFTTV